MNRNFQEAADAIAAATCIVSVEKLPDGGCGEIRIVTGNKAYIESMELPSSGVELRKREFVPNSLYTEYLDRDLNFEDFCYRSAVQKKCLHSYAHPDRFDVWFNMTFMPLWPDEGNLCYCMYSMEINTEADSERLSNVSGDIAAAVLSTAIRLRESVDFKTAMKDVVRDIRELCEAEYCGILLVDNEHETCEVLGEDFIEGSKLRPKDHYLETEFYAIASTWKDTISGSSCLIAKNENDLSVVAERNPVWYRSLRIAGVRTIALFPLKARNEHLGYMWATNFQADRAQRIKEILELTTFVLGSETGSYLMLNQLRDLSSRDMLTGVMNRNEMNSYVDMLAELPEGGNSSVGVIFTDLNGLKRINDVQGHEAGDRLLQNAARALREVFDTRTVFRAGGDEFVVILTDVSPEEVEAKAQALAAAAGHYPEVSFAIGYSVEADSRDVRSALAEADERMYEDKKRHHARRG